MLLRQAGRFDNFTMNYQVADFITRIKNASLARRKKVNMPYSGMVREIANVLVEKDFLESVKEQDIKGKKFLEATVKFDRRIPVVSDVQIISKPSLRVYVGSRGIKEIEKKGMTTVVMSTNKGIMVGKDAVKRGIGGEVLFKIW